MFPHCSICTELHCRIYCCQIQTNIHIVAPSIIPTSRVTVIITFSALDTSTLYAEDNCRKINNFNVRVPRSEVDYNTNDFVNIYKTTLCNLIFLFKLFSYLRGQYNCVSEPSVTIFYVACLKKFISRYSGLNAKLSLLFFWSFFTGTLVHVERLYGN